MCVIMICKCLLVVSGDIHHCRECALTGALVRLVSDCMGQPPLIPKNSFTTRIPADVDEEKFSPSSTTVPTALTESGEVAQTYLGLRCKCVFRTSFLKIRQMD